MTVFKNYFKIVKKHLGTIIMFSSIAIGIAIVNTSYNAESTFVSSTPKIAIINNDNSKLTDDFSNYIAENAKMVEVKNDKKAVQDALYNNKVDTIFIIPKNFTDNLLNGKKPEIEVKKSTQNYSSTAIVLANKYFKIADIYASAKMSEDEIIKNINEDLKNEVSVIIQNREKGAGYNKLAIFYSYENYAFLSVFIYIIGTIMCIFNKDTIKKRNSISSTKNSSFSKQLFLGHSCLTLLIWLIFVIISFIIYKDLMVSLNGLLLIINSLIFAITITSLAYMLGSLIKNQNVISGVQNVFGLGLSFISGCFISIELLDPNIVNVAKFFPPYWFIQTNYEIAKLAKFDFNSLTPIFNNMVIVILFGIGFYLVSIIANKLILRK